MHENRQEVMQKFRIFFVGHLRQTPIQSKGGSDSTENASPARIDGRINRRRRKHRRQSRSDFPNVL